MRVQDLSSHRGGMIPAHGPIDLAVRVAQTISPGTTGALVRIELDLALELPDDEAALVFATPALAQAGLLAVGGPVVVSASDPIRPLSLLVLSPRAPVRLEPGQTIARLVIVRPPSQTFYHDPGLAPETRLGPGAVPFSWPDGTEI